LGNIATVTDAAGNAYSYAYDPAGNLVTVTYPDGAVKTYHYNEPGYTTGNLPNALTGLTDENGARYSIYRYEVGNKATSSELANGVNKYSVYYASQGTGTQVSVTDPLGSVRTFGVSNSLGTSRLTSQSQPAGSGCAASSSSMGYDPQGNITQRDDFNGKRMCYAYDLSRNLEKVRLEGLSTSTACPADVAAHTIAAPAAGANIEQRKVSTLWHPDWRLEVRKAEPLKITTWVYNGQPDPTASNAVASCAPASALLPDGKPIAVLCKQVEQATTDATGTQAFTATTSGSPRVWSYTYNAEGQVLTANGPRTEAGINDLTTTTYHAATTADVTRGDIASVTNAAGHIITYPKYDKHGNVLRMIDTNGTVTDYTYDLRQRLTSRTVTPQGAPVGERWSYEYDLAGQLKKATNPDGSYTAYTYDAAHRLTAVADNLGNQVVYTLDNMGNRIKEESKDPAGVLKRNIARTYDALNRLMTVTGSVQ
jgi:YD repeat-containing protein